MIKLSIEYLLINLKFLLLKILSRAKFSIWLKILNKLVSQLRNKEKLRLLLDKSMNFGVPKNSSSVLGAKEKILFLEVCVLLILLKGLKKIKWLLVQSMLKDMLFHSKSRLKNLSEDFQTRHKFLISGLRYKHFGEV